MFNYTPKDDKIKEDVMKLNSFLADCGIEVLSIETDPCYCTLLKWKLEFEDSNGFEDGFTNILFEKIRKKFNFELSELFSNGVIVFHHEEARAMWQRRSPVYNE